MTLNTHPRVARPLAADDSKPTRINEHKRAADARLTEHEPHAMASQRRSRREGRAQ